MTNNKQQTAVEWLYNELLFAELNILEWNKLLEQAKEMDKGIIIKAYNEDLYGGLSGQRKFNDGEDYYEQTYGGGEQ
jgi:hypothetical protein